MQSVYLAPPAGWYATWHVATSCKAEGWDSTEAASCKCWNISVAEQLDWYLSFNMPVSKNKKEHTIIDEQRTLLLGLEQKYCAEIPLSRKKGASELTLA